MSTPSSSTPPPRPLRAIHTPSPSTEKPHHLPNSRGFVNPWPSWAKPSLYELWSGLSWDVIQGGHSSSSGNESGKDGDAAEDDDDDDDEGAIKKSPSPSSASPPPPPPPLAVTQPRFDSPASSSSIRTWWLGHAGVLIEFPSSPSPTRIVFDPIFSLRCSPTQYFGPTRFYPSPCTVEDLPPIDVVLISHNHYDHLDADTIAGLWQRNSDRLRFVVPLGNRSWFDGLIGAENTDRVTECDWWDEVQLNRDEGDGGEKEIFPSPSPPLLRIACTPAQHGSGRMGLDVGSSLWCSYTIFYKDTKIFFGGDTGYRLRPPPPASPTAFPACPAFADIHKRYGTPDFLLLPISVGSTYSYVKSWDAFGLLPNVNGGLTAQNHLDEWEAIEVAKILCGGGGDGGEADDDAGNADVGAGADSAATPSASPASPQVMAIHFGTFSPPDETQRNIDTLKRACDANGWEMHRRGGDTTEDGAEDQKAIGSISADTPRFYVLDHGAHLDLQLKTRRR